MSDYPEPIDTGKTHYASCRKERGHHNCAVARCEALLAENERLRKRLLALAEAADKYLSESTRGSMDADIHGWTLDDEIGAAREAAKP